MREDLESGAEGDGESQGLDFSRVLDFVRRRRVSVLLVTIPLLIPATILPFLPKHYYEATATVAIQATPKQLDFGGDTLPGGMGVGHTQQAIESTIVTLVNSDTVIGAVVDQLPAGAKPQMNLLDYVKARLLGEEYGRPPTAQQDREIRIEVLREMIDVQLSGGGTFLQIRARGASPDAAAWLANGVADSYVRYLQIQRDDASKRAVTWLNQQIYELRDQIGSKESAAAELVAKNGVSPSVAVRDKDNNDSVSTVDGALQSARIDLLGARQRLAELEPRVVGGTSGKSAEVRQLREDYTAAQRALESARLRFTPTHPEVVRLEAVVANLQQRLAATGASDLPALNAAEELEYQHLRGEVTRLESRANALEKARDDMLGDGGGVRSEATSRYKRLQSELEIDQQMLSVLLTRRNESLLTAADKQSGAYVLDYAVAPLWPAGPVRKKYLALGWAAALAAGVSVGLLRELLDRRVRDPDAVARALGVQTIGLIPQIDDRKTVPEHQSERARRGPAAEGYRNLRTSILFAMRENKLHSILVTSAIAGEGKTTTSVNLSSAFAQMGRRVIMIDADLRRARVDRVFNIPRGPGLSDVLEGKLRVEDCVQRPDSVNFDVLTAGAAPENPSELLASNAFAELMATLKSEYDFVILDSPVLLAVPDALLLAADADATLLVHRPGSVELRALRRMREDLRRAGARVIGVVFNCVSPGDGSLYPPYLESPYLEDTKKKRRLRGERT
ncbi:MAG TPA: polysaccharide biosynthesis tyrosine autokinase [Myxococcota bacterium]|nr:polysaccharide biosynthesis tyrosine autokinase [Myxococcota bacterium]